MTPGPFDNSITPWKTLERNRDENLLTNLRGDIFSRFQIPDSQMFFDLQNIQQAVRA
jgi:hypothetical protein